MSKRRPKFSYDPKCEELARYFLSDVGRPDLVKELAQHIQNEIEGWIAYEITPRPAEGRQP